MADPLPLRYDMILPNGEPLRWDMGLEYTWDGNVPASAYPNPPPPMSADNQISAAITPQNIALFNQKLDEALALLPALPDITDADLKRLLSIDQSTELDEIAAEALAAHPAWKPFVVDATEYAKDAALFNTTAPMDTKAAAVARKVVILRRLAAHDTRRATLAIYNQLAELAARGNTDAQGYYDRMKAHFPRTPKTPKPPKPPTP